MEQQKEIDDGENKQQCEKKTDDHHHGLVDFERELVSNDGASDYRRIDNLHLLTIGEENPASSPAHRERRQKSKEVEEGEIEDGLSEEKSETSLLGCSHGVAPNAPVSIITGLSQEELQAEVLALRNENQSLRNDNQSLRNEAATVTEGESLLMSELIHAFLAGLFGFAAPLVFDLDATLEWMGCGSRKRTSESTDRDNRPHESVSGDVVGHSDNLTSVNRNFRSRESEPVWKRLRIPYYVLISAADFSDAVLDVVVSLQALLEDTSNDNLGIRGWAVLLFSMTIFARTVGGVFGVLYKQVDESNREFTYFLVEMTIFLTEDTAAAIYISLKAIKGVGFNGWDKANIWLTIFCGIVFVVPTLFQYKSLAKPIPVFAARAIYAWYLYIFASIIFIIVCMLVNRSTYLYSTFTDLRMFRDVSFESFWIIAYPIWATTQLFVFCYWNHTLYLKKEQEEPQDLEQGDSAFMSTIASNDSRL